MPPLIGEESLASLRKLETPGEPSFIKEFLTALLEQLPDHSKCLKDAILNSNWNEVAKHSHAIGSSCSNAGVAAVEDVCKRLEEMAASRNLKGAEELFRKLCDLCEQLVVEVHSLPEFRESEKS